MHLRTVRLFSSEQGGFTLLARACLQTWEGRRSVSLRQKMIFLIATDRNLKMMLQTFPEKPDPSPNRGTFLVIGKLNGS